MAKRAPTERTRRIAEQIKKDVSILIQRELRDPRVGMVTIQEVQLTPDYAHAKLYFTVMAAEPAVAEKALNESSVFFTMRCSNYCAFTPYRRCISNTTALRPKLLICRY